MQSMKDIQFTRQEWHARRDRHLVRVSAMAEAFVQRRSRGEKHPVHDFLFTYYNFSPAKLKRWQTPLGIGMEVTEEDLLEEILANNSRYKPEPLFSKTGTGSLSSASTEERASEVQRSTELIQKAMERSRLSGRGSKKKRSL